jgi:hypothetical protein
MTKQAESFLLNVIQRRVESIAEHAAKRLRDEIDTEEFFDRSIVQHRLLESDLHEYWRLTCSQSNSSIETGPPLI